MLGNFQILMDLVLFRVCLEGKEGRRETRKEGGGEGGDSCKLGGDATCYGTLF